MASQRLKTSGTMSWLRYSVIHSTRSPASPGSSAASRFSPGGFHASVAPPDAQPRPTRKPAKRLDEVIHALGRDVRADVAEGERLARQSFPSGQPFPVKPVVQVSQLALRQPEVIAEPRQQVTRRRDEQVHRVADPPRVGHAPPHPARPVFGVPLELVAVVAEVATVAAHRALAVVLPVAHRPGFGVRVAVHLDELPARDT